MRVLVADDDPVGRQMMATAIELLGHDVLSAVDGREALDLYLGERPEILVLDWMMPHMDGIAVARGVRSLEASYAVRTEDLIEGKTQPVETGPMIVLATAFDEPQLMASALEAGVDDYMIKPVTMAEIRTRIAIAVERYQLRRRTEERERALRRERGRAEALNQARARFLANMSHELRTPLNGMVGMSDFLLTGEISSEQQEAVEIIRASALSLDVIINDILELTQVEEGRVPIDLRPFEVRTLMEQVVGLYRTRAENAGLQLGMRIADDVPPVLVGDQTRIRQVLSNLVNNALKYTTKGCIEVTLGVASSVAEIERYRFEVKDTGPGIAPEDRANLFLRFFRAGDRDEPGFGLGLAICRGLAELMGGQLDVQSTLGSGSTFWFELPLSQAHALESDVNREIKRPKRSIRALVVEDDRFNQTVARRLLERAGCEVIIADNGRSGVQRVDDARPDVVFMDVQMPVMNGLEAARVIRTEENGGLRRPIIGLTASTTAGARQRCFDAGMDGYLKKPVQLSAIIDALIEHLPDRYE